MSYKLRPGRSPAKEIGRIALQELKAAEVEIGNTNGNGGAAIHGVRKRLKRLRGLLRLMRATDPKLYRDENARFRDAAKSLSAVRDRIALMESLDALTDRFGSDAAIGPISSLRSVLARKRQAAMDTASLPAAVAVVTSTLEEARKDWQDWEGKHSARSAGLAILDGLQDNYRRAREALKAAKRKGDAEAFHELRKRAKYHAMHLKLLSAAWPEALHPAREVADTVADDLGRDHDYAVLRAEIVADPAAYGLETELDDVISQIGVYQDELRASALLACERLFSEKPGAFRRRIDSYLDLSSKRGTCPSQPTWRDADKQAHPVP